MAEATQGALRGKIAGVQGVSRWSDAAATLIPARPDAPQAPSSVSATGALETIVVSWETPTKYADGSTLKEGALLEYHVYHASGSSIDITDSASYDGMVRILGTEYSFPVPEQGGSAGPYYFVVTAVDRDKDESAASSEVSASFVTSYNMSGRTLVGAIVQSPDWGITSGFQLNGPSGTFRMGGSSAPGIYMTTGGDAQFGTDLLVLDAANSTMTVEATVRTSSSGKRIQIPGSGGDADELFAYDTSNKKRAAIRDTGVEVWNTSGEGVANRLAFFSSVAASGAWLYHDVVYITQDLVVGAASDPGGSWDAWVSGPAHLGDGSQVSGTLAVGDHAPTGSTAYVVNVLFATGSAPTASDHPIGTLFCKYSA